MKKLSSIFLLIAFYLMVSIGGGGCHKDTVNSPDIFYTIQGETFSGKIDNEMTIIHFNGNKNGNVNLTVYKELEGGFNDSNYIYQESATNFSSQVSENGKIKSSLKLNDGSYIIVYHKDNGYYGGNSYMPNVSIDSIDLNGEKCYPYSFDIQFGIATQGQIGRWTLNNVPINRTCSFEAYVNGALTNVVYSIADTNVEKTNQEISIKTLGINGEIINKPYSTPIIRTSDGDYIIAFYAVDGKPSSCSCYNIGFNLYVAPNTSDLKSSPILIKCY